jgi:hypothetical protein
VSKPRPKPIRLTKTRALALLAAAGRGCDEWEAHIQDYWETDDLETIRGLKEMDLERAAALDAMAIVRARYLDGPAPTAPHPTLFD